jgi:hypothetical protein
VKRLTDEEFYARLNEFHAEARFLELEACARKLLRCGTALSSAAIQAREAVEFSLPAWQFIRPDGSIGICAWCQADQGVKPEPHQSHGICPQHKEKMLADARAIQSAAAAREALPTTVREVVA